MAIELLSLAPQGLLNATGGYLHQPLAKIQIERLFQDSTTPIPGRRETAHALFVSVQTAMADGRKTRASR